MEQHPAECHSNDSAILHVILTRFNVASGGREQKIRQGETWLSERFELFEKFCLPSVRAQTRNDFVWLVFFDRETAPHFNTKIESYRDFRQFHPVYVGEWSSEAVASAILRHVNPAHRMLLTTRLDNDDALNQAFVATLRGEATDGGRFYNLPHGLIFRSGSLFRHVDMSNAFASLLEPIDNFQTVWHIQHQSIIHSGSVSQIPLAEAWVQVIHGTNVSNRIRGRRLGGGTWPDGYTHLGTTAINRESRATIICDHLVWFPLRHVRDKAIRWLKRLLRLFKAGSSH